MKDLGTLLADHRAAPFPRSVVKGLDYGEVDAVMIDADIYLWGLEVSRGTPLSRVDRQRLQEARNRLARSLSAFPDTARPYYRQLVERADAALSA